MRNESQAISDSIWKNFKYFQLRRFIYAYSERISQNAIFHTRVNLFSDLPQETWEKVNIVDSCLRLVQAIKNMCIEYGWVANYWSSKLEYIDMRIAKSYLLRWEQLCSRSRLNELETSCLTNMDLRSIFVLFPWYVTISTQFSHCQSRFEYFIRSNIFFITLCT